MSLLYAPRPDARVLASLLGSKAFLPASTISSSIFGCAAAEVDELAMLRQRLMISLKSCIGEVIRLEMRKSQLV
jgi:hypothetical protein